MNNGRLKTQWNARNCHHYERAVKPNSYKAWHEGGKNVMCACRTETSHAFKWQIDAITQPDHFREMGKYFFFLFSESLLLSDSGNWSVKGTLTICTDQEVFIRISEKFMIKWQPGKATKSCLGPELYCAHSGVTEWCRPWITPQLCPTTSPESTIAPFLSQTQSPKFLYFCWFFFSLVYTVTALPVRYAWCSSSSDTCISYSMKHL